MFDSLASCNLRFRKKKKSFGKKFQNFFENIEKKKKSYKQKYVFLTLGHPYYSKKINK